MNYDEFAFFNQQLAAMLRDGIPLEGALLRLSGEMRQSPLRSELEQLAADLAKGVPLREAARARKLPELYSQLLEVGVQSNDLPAALTLLADYYQRRQVIWTRLKGLMVYPVIVLFCAFLLSCFCSVLLSFLIRITSLAPPGWRPNTVPLLAGFWVPPVFLGLAFVAVFAAATAPPLRRVLRWRLPGFKEASLAQVAGAMSLMLKSGVSLNDALALVEELEKGTPAQLQLSGWRDKLAAGRGKFSEMAAGGNIFPPLFVWMVGNSGEDVGSGFQRASEVYQSRANYRTEMLLYAALPCAVLALGLMIISQIWPALAVFSAMMQGLGSVSG